MKILEKCEWSQFNRSASALRAGIEPLAISPAILALLGRRLSHKNSLPHSENSDIYWVTNRILVEIPACTAS